tara:strand:+ start:1800 stop:2312 length:513 start_codon:yes stop_codon:yes gene_type:complete
MQVKLFSKKIIFFTFFFIFFFISVSRNEGLVVEIDNPRFSEKGLDDKTYEIKAAKGLRSDDELKLFTIEGKFKTDRDGKWVFLEAEKGYYFQSMSFIKLEKNIRFYTDEGEVLKSNFATFDMNNDIIKFIENVSHDSINGFIVADNSVVSQNFNKILYEGNVITTINIKD